MCFPYYLDFTDGRTEAQRGAETHSRSHRTGRAGILGQAWDSLPDITVQSLFIVFFFFNKKFKALFRYS